MGKRGRELARERRQQRRDQIAELRLLPYAMSERWWAAYGADVVAVVTGANRGIGFELARQLASHGIRVVLGARDATRGNDAAAALREEGSSLVEARQLDVADHASVARFAQWVESELGAIDILINNAGVNFNSGADNSVEFAEQVININYIGTKRMIQAMLPYMKPSPYGARILNVSSRLGRVNGRRNRVGDISLRNQLLQDECLSEELIDGMVVNFLEQVKQGTWNTCNEWPRMYTDYSVSKLAVNAYTRLMGRKLSERPEGHKIYINSYCPGWVKTAMTHWEGNMSTEEGADTGVWLVLRPQEQMTNGKFFAERREISF